jgi:hypothetical protein
MNASATVQAVPIPPTTRSLRSAVDAGFPRRVLLSSLILTALGVMYACLLGLHAVAIGLGAGGVIGGGAFVVLAWTVGLLIGGGAVPGWRKAAVVAIALVKIPLLAVALWLALYRLGAHPGALLAGLAMTQVVMALKVGGSLLKAKMSGGGEAATNDPGPKDSMPI